MSLKRKLVPPPTTETPPQKVQVSAFAAARSGPRISSSSNSIYDGNSESSDNDEAVAEVDTDALDLRDNAGQEVDDDDTSDQEYDGSVNEPIDTDFQHKPFSTWDSTPLPVSDNVVLIRMKPNEIITIVGQYDIWVRAGVVVVYGATLGPDTGPLRVYAPTTHALPQIRCHSSGPCQFELWNCAYTMKSLSKISPLFRNLWNVKSNKKSQTSSDQPPEGKQSFQLLRGTKEVLNRRTIYPMDHTQDWHDTILRICLASQHKRTKVLVCGPKGAGKSTFSRLLSNYLVTRPKTAAPEASPPQRTVSWLDLDPGQPEFSTPGQMSLVQLRAPILGPSFTHSFLDPASPYKIIKAHSIVATSPRENPDHYLECAVDLHACYAKHEEILNSSSLVINCPGWVVGSGLEIMTQLIKLLSVTDIVFVGREIASQYTGNFVAPQIMDTLVSAAGDASFHKIKAAHRPAGQGIAPLDLRQMQDISYFHHGASVSGNPKWDGSVLTTRAPWTLRYRSDLLGILVVGEHPDPAFLATVLEGSLVAICVMQDDNDASEARSNLTVTTSEHLPYWPCGESGFAVQYGPARTQTIGLAYIQEIDTEAGTMDLQTPLSTVAIMQASSKTAKGVPRIFLMYGNLDHPNWAHLEATYNVQKRTTISTNNHELPYDDEDTEDLSIEVSALPDNYDASEEVEVEEDVDESIANLPWVKQLKPGEVAGQRWRVRNDIGRSARRRGRGRY